MEVEREREREKGKKPILLGSTRKLAGRSIAMAPSEPRRKSILTDTYAVF